MICYIEQYEAGETGIWFEDCVIQEMINRKLRATEWKLGFIGG